MDNFMDKLAKRFNAGEIIKANSQAEARDLKRMQERTAEYERMMQEMRRLNLKNIEVTEQVQQMIQCGIEQFEGQSRGDELLANKIDRTGADLISEAEALKVLIRDNGDFLKSDMGSVKDSVESVRVHIDSVISNTESVNDHIDSVKGNIESVKKDIGSFKGNIDSVKDSVESIKGSVSDAAFKTEEGFYRVSGRLDEMERAINEELQQNHQAVFVALRDLEDKAGGDGEMKEAIRTMKELLVGLKVSTEEGQKHLEEHVHKENIRVYRNVQAELKEEAARKAREMGERMDKLESNMKKNSGLKPLVLITLLLALAGLGIQVAQILQLF